MTTDPNLTPKGDGETSTHSAPQAEEAPDSNVMVEDPSDTPANLPDEPAGETPEQPVEPAEDEPAVKPADEPAPEPQGEQAPTEPEPVPEPEAEAPQALAPEPEAPAEPVEAIQEAFEPPVEAEVEALSDVTEPPQDTVARAEPDEQSAESNIVAPVKSVEDAGYSRPVEVEVAKLSDAQLFDQAMSALESGDEEAGTEGGFKKLSKGDRVEATVIQVDKDRVFVDLGTKSEGVVPLAELTDTNIEHAQEHVKVGDKIQVIVLRPEGAEGNAVVSKKRADFEEAWDKIEQSFEEGKFLSALVVDRVKGGLVVDIGVRGFVPATHVGNGRLRNIEKFVGQNLQLKIIEIDRERKKVVLSNRQAEEERRVHAKENIFQNVTPGETLEGTVRRLVDYGAFIDLGGVDGLLHISEMSWMQIAHPKEMFKEGQKIKVMVLRLDPSAGKISLGHRQVLPDPWNLIRDAYTIGQKLTCTIGRIVQTGAFIKLAEGAEAFLPLSEMSMRRIRRAEEAVSEGQEIEVQIIDLRPDDRRMVLSMRAAGSADRGGPMSSAPPSYEEDRDLRRGAGPVGGKKRGKGKPGAGGRGRGGEEDDFEEVGGRRGFATGGATIGERLGMLKGFTLRDEDVDEEADETAADEPGAQVTDEAVTDSTVEATPEPAAEPAVEAPAEPADEPVKEPEAEPVEEPAPEPETDPEPEPKSDE